MSSRQGSRMRASRPGSRTATSSTSSPRSGAQLVKTDPPAPAWGRHASRSRAGPVGRTAATTAPPSAPSSAHLPSWAHDRPDGSAHRPPSTTRTRTRCQAAEHRRHRVSTCRICGPPGRPHCVVEPQPVGHDGGLSRRAPALGGRPRAAMYTGVGSLEEWCGTGRVSYAVAGARRRAWSSTTSTAPSATTATSSASRTSRCWAIPYRPRGSHAAGAAALLQQASTVTSDYSHRRFGDHAWDALFLVDDLDVIASDLRERAPPSRSGPGRTIVARTNTRGP